MQLVRYNPLQELQRVDKDFDKLWNNGWGLLPTLTEASSLDMYEEDGKLVVEVTLPNCKKEEVRVTVEEGVLEILAIHKEEQQNKSKRRYYFQENSNTYFRRVTLPEGVKTGKADATFKDGVLKVAMPMSKSKKATAVTVK